MNKKRCIKQDGVKHIVVPQYDSLELKKVLSRWGAHEAFIAHMPDPRELPKLPRDWILNIAHTVIGDEFGNWILQQVEERNAKMAIERN